MAAIKLTVQCSKCGEYRAVGAACPCQNRVRITARDGSVIYEGTDMGVADRALVEAAKALVSKRRERLE